LSIQDRCYSIGKLGCFLGRQLLRSAHILKKLIKYLIQTGIWNLNYEGTNDNVWWELFSKKYRGTVFYEKDKVFFLTAKLSTSLRVWDSGQNVEYNMIIMCLVIILPLHKLPLFMYDRTVLRYICGCIIRVYWIHTEVPHTRF